MIAAVFLFELFVPCQSYAEASLSVGSKIDPALMTVGISSIGNIAANRDSAVALSVEYRAGPRLEAFFMRPVAGVTITTDTSFYAWLGLAADLFFMNQLVFTPQFGVGGYSKGDGQDLGGVFELRTGAILAWRFESYARVGIGFHHISNAGTGDRNPGTESLGLFYSHPLNFR